MKIQPVAMFLLIICAAMSVAGDDTPAANGVVNINTAASEQLQLLPRVGPALAGRIIEYREANGPFKTVEEVLAVKGIGDSSFDRLHPYLVTSGATTLSEKVRVPRAESDGAPKS